tara:strand:+ start:2901 stop:3725 length:825 start_codon:yes stop_codon:yes gene_type:complete
MKKIIQIMLFISILIGDKKFWDSHSAYILPKKRYEIGLFQPFRYGYSDNLEYSTYPLWSIVMPNITFKKRHNSFSGYQTASRFKIFYPTPILNIVAREGIGGLIDPNFTMPPMIGISASWIMTNPKPTTDITLNIGLDLGLNLGEIDERSNIDLPLIYQRLGVFHNGWGVHTGIDIQKQIHGPFEVLMDADLKALPWNNSNKEQSNLLKILGKYAIEHKFLLIYERSERFRILTGYKFVHGKYPFGTETRLLPFIPMLDKWVPIIELHWAGSRK